MLRKHLPLALLCGLPLAALGPVLGLAPGPAWGQSANISTHATSPFEGWEVVFSFQYHGPAEDIENLELAFETVDATAVAGEDYVASAGTVRITAADPSPTTGSVPLVRIPIPTLIDQDGTEGLEHFNLQVTVTRDGETVSTQTIQAGIRDAWWRI